MIKNILFSMVLLFGLSTLHAQSYIGFNTDNYNGIHGVISNPANIVDSRFKTDISLFSISGYAGNDYFAFDFGKALSGNDLVEANGDFSTTVKDKNNIFGNVDIMGPSFMINLSEKHSIGFFTRARAFANLNDVNGDLFNNLDDQFDENQDVTFNEGDVAGTLNSWVEYGLSYATVILNKEQHFLKGGLSAKYLNGLGNAYTQGNNIVADYRVQAMGPNLVDTQGSLIYGNSDNLEGDTNDFGIVDNSSGFGFDVGFVYEWRPNYADYKATTANGKTYTYKDVNKYKLKLGLSVTDIGSVTYKNVLQSTYNINQNNINEDDFNNANDFEEALRNIYTFTEERIDVSASLPTALHLNADYNLHKKFYLNLNADFSLTGKTALNTNNVVGNYVLTPRFETKWFSAYLPAGINQYGSFSLGTGFRIGPFFAGSGSILSNLIKDQTKVGDFYAGLKIPVYHSKAKDIDGDGIVDKLDGCPKVAGPIENNGCPWEDTDSDKVLDKDDACPEIKGPAENNGCPWKDTDEDSILDKDDNCPEEAGPAENNGCPWPDTDGDLVYDKDDGCPQVAGSVANKGCPEITEDVVDKLNTYAKTILFNSGKATFKEETLPQLNAMTEILAQYPDSKFIIEGHTDSVGSARLNQRLSDERSNAVKEFLISKGIESSRLESIGYGEDRPIATNRTRKGRTENRRVVIKLKN